MQSLSTPLPSEEENSLHQHVNEKKTKNISEQTLQSIWSEFALTAQKHSARSLQGYPINGIKQPHEMIKRLSLVSSSKTIGNEMASLKQARPIKIGLPTSLIYEIEHQELAEQLIELNLLFNIKYSANQMYLSSKVMTDLTKLTKQAIDRSDSLAVTQASELIGEVTFLLNYNSEEFLDIIQKHSSPYYFAAISTSAHLYLRKIVCEIKNQHRAFVLAPLQNTKLARNQILAAEIAKIIIIETGAVNIGIISGLIDILVGNKKFYNSYETGLMRALKYLTNSKELRSHIKNIRAPFATDSVVNNIIQIILGLDSDTLITNLQAKQAALTALLSHLRQGPSNSCFATSLAIECSQNHVEQCLTDLEELLHTGKISRMVGKKNCDFSFLLSIPNKDLEQSFVVNSQGQIVKGKKLRGYLWQSVGLIAACRAMKIVRTQEEIEKVFKKLWTAKSDTFLMRMTPKQLIKIIAGDCVNNTTSTFTLGCFAFSSQTNNALLEIWRNSIADMAEGIEKSRMKAAIIRSVIQTCRMRFKLLHPNKNLPNSLMQNLLKALKQTINVRYDPSKTLASNCRQMGAFVLYAKNFYGKDSCWQAIDSIDSFVKFLSELITTTINKSGFSDEEAELFSMLAKDAHQEAFVLLLLWIYHPQNVVFPSIKELLRHQTFTPWHTSCGFDSLKMLQIYCQKGERPDSLKFIPKNAKDLLIKIIGLNKGLSQKLQATEPNKFPTTLPIRVSEVHAFSLFTTHPTLPNIAQGDLKVKKWINQQLIKQGEKLGKARLSFQTCQKAIHLIARQLHKKQDRLAFIKSASQIDNPISLRDFRAALLHILKTSHKERSYATKVDSCLLESLPINLKQEFINSAVHIADTNWSNGSADWHFCIAFNPGSGQIELFKATDDNRAWKALDQNQWISGKNWEIFGYDQTLASAIKDLQAA